jgi:hypothetical protein
MDTFCDVGTYFMLQKYASSQEITPAMIKHYWTEMLHAVQVIHKVNKKVFSM